MYYGFIPIKWRHLPLRCHFSRKQLFLSKTFWYYFHFWFIFGDKLNSGNHSSGVNGTFNRNVERCVLNIWDELNVMWACGSCEWKYLGDICTMKGVTVQKVFLKGRVWVASVQNFNLHSPPFMFFVHKYHIFDKYVTKIFPPGSLGSLASSETCEHVLPTRASTCFLHVRARASYTCEHVTCSYVLDYYLKMCVQGGSTRTSGVSWVQGERQGGPRGSGGSSRYPWGWKGVLGVSQGSREV